MNLFKEILNRRIPQIVVSYLVTGTATKNELNSLNDSTHQFYELEAKKGGRCGVTSTTGIKIKVEEVYDSTAIGRIYKSEDPNIKLRVGI